MPNPGIYKGEMMMIIMTAAVAAVTMVMVTTYRKVVGIWNKQNPTD